MFLWDVADVVEEEKEQRNARKELIHLSSQILALARAGRVIKNPLDASCGSSIFQEAG